MKHIFNLIFAESATMISMHSNFLITLTYQVFCAYLLFLNSACIGFKMRFHVFATGPLFSWSISGNWGMYLFTYPYNVLCNYWVFMCFSDNFRYFWLIAFSVKVLFSSISNLSDFSFPTPIVMSCSCSTT